MQESLDCCSGIYPCRSKAPWPIWVDLSQINVRSASFRQESTCRISSPYTKAFYVISCLQSLDEKEIIEYEKQNKNIMVAARYSRATVISFCCEKQSNMSCLINVAIETDADGVAPTGCCACFNPCYTCQLSTRLGETFCLPLCTGILPLRMKTRYVLGIQVRHIVHKRTSFMYRIHEPDKYRMLYQIIIELRMSWWWLARISNSMDWRLDHFKKIFTGMQAKKLVVSSFSG
jgi:hypothetical protein